MDENYNNNGIVYRVISDYPQALEYHKKALEINTELIMKWISQRIVIT
jgi:hypothetical protein